MATQDMLLALSALLLLPPLGALLLTLVNVASWPRPRVGPTGAPRVSVLIPARDEERCVEGCVRAVLASTAPVAEVLIYDDGSRDRTPAILARLAASDPRVRVLEGGPLPPGWIGKPHACHQLALAARGEVLVFLDADVRLHPDGLCAVLAERARRGADVLSAFPRQDTQTLVEKLVLPLLHLSLTSFLPLALVSAVRDPRVVAASGQLVVVTREAYDGLGGFDAVKGAIVDDVAFCRRAKEVGLKVVFSDGHHLARCRMYTSGHEVLNGFAKNLYAGIGARPLALVLVLALYVACFVAPWVALVVGAAGYPSLVVPAALGVGANVAQRGVLALRHSHSIWAVALHPVAIVAFVAIALRSWWWHTRGEVRWRGRRYALAGGHP